MRATQHRIELLAFACGPTVAVLLVSLWFATMRELSRIQLDRIEHNVAPQFLQEHCQANRSETSCVAGACSTRLDQLYATAWAR